MCQKRTLLQSLYDPNCSIPLRATHFLISLLCQRYQVSQDNTNVAVVSCKLFARLKTAMPAVVRCQELLCGITKQIANKLVKTQDNGSDKFQSKAQTPHTISVNFDNKGCLHEQILLLMCGKFISL